MRPHDRVCVRVGGGRAGDYIFIIYYKNIILSILCLTFYLFYFSLSGRYTYDAPWLGFAYLMSVARPIA